MYISTQALRRGPNEQSRINIKKGERKTEKARRKQVDEPSQRPYAYTYIHPRVLSLSSFTFAGSRRVRVSPKNRERAPSSSGNLYANLYVFFFFFFFFFFAASDRVDTSPSTSAPLGLIYGQRYSAARRARV